MATDDLQAAWRGSLEAVGEELRKVLKEGFDSGFAELQANLCAELRNICDGEAEVVNVEYRKTRTKAQPPAPSGMPAGWHHSTDDTVDHDHDWARRHVRPYLAAPDFHQLRSQKSVHSQRSHNLNSRPSSTRSFGKGSVNLTRFTSPHSLESPRNRGTRLSSPSTTSVLPVLPHDTSRNIDESQKSPDDEDLWQLNSIPAGRDTSAERVKFDNRSMILSPSIRGDTVGLSAALSIWENGVSQSQRPVSWMDYQLSVPQSRPLAIEDYSPLRQRALQLVSWRGFDTLVCLIIILNTIAVGYQVEYTASRLTLNLPDWLEGFDFCCGVIFVLEIICRIYAYRGRFFYNRNWRWNIFDLIIVVVQVLETIGALLIPSSASTDRRFAFVRVLRLLRFVRVVRLVRILRMITELRTLVSGIMGSMKSLGWTVLLLFLLIYPVSLYLTQLVSDVRIDDDHSSADISSLTLYYGSLGSTMLTMFQSISGGVDWDNAMRPLAEHVSPWAAVVLSSYIAFSLLAMMNVVTGIFVDSVLRSAQTDRDMYLMNNARELFQRLDGGLQQQMTWDVFEENLLAPQMQELLKAMDVDSSEARGLFNLLDLDHSGALSADEFLNGCLRLRGPAKGLDLAVLLKEVRQLRKQVNGRFRHHTQRSATSSVGGIEEGA